jgi:8-oxo-dGTP diphosphatase
MTGTEQRFLDEYDPRAYPPAAVTADVVALTIRDDRLHVLLVLRERPPFAGRWALPGTFLRAGADRETLTEAAARVLATRTGLAADPEPAVGRVALGRVHLEQLATYGDPGRDPRMTVVSVAYLAFGPGLPDPVRGDGAADVAWVPVDEVALPGSPGAIDLAFDHARILADGLDRAQAKLEYTTLATSFVDEAFTLPDLLAVYEAVWGERLHAPNFRRKVLATPGFVVPTGAVTERGGRRGGRRAALYRAGTGRILHPPILREATAALAPEVSS